MTNKYLIVDDDDSMRDLLCVFFEDEAEILSAKNGKEALNLMMEHDDITLVVSDIHMPIMNGLAFCRQAMNVIEDFAKHLILFTGNPTEEIELFCRNHQITLLSKPVSMLTLRKTVDHLLDNIRELREYKRTHLPNILSQGCIPR